MIRSEKGRTILTGPVSEILAEAECIIANIIFDTELPGKDTLMDALAAIMEVYMTEGTKEDYEAKRSKQMNEDMDGLSEMLKEKGEGDPIAEQLIKMCKQFQDELNALEIKKSMDMEWNIGEDEE